MNPLDAGPLDVLYACLSFWPLAQRLTVEARFLCWRHVAQLHRSPRARPARSSASFFVWRNQGAAVANRQTSRREARSEEGARMDSGQRRKHSSRHTALLRWFWQLLSLFVRDASLSSRNVGFFKWVVHKSPLDESSVSTSLCDRHGRQAVGVYIDTLQQFLRASMGTVQRFLTTLRLPIAKALSSMEAERASGFYKCCCHFNCELTALGR